MHRSVSEAATGSSEIAGSIGGVAQAASATTAGVAQTRQAAEELAGMGISAEVINLRSLRPMDLPTVIESVKKTNRCVTVEEGWPQGSVGSYIGSQIMQEAFDHLDAPVISLTGKDVPMPYAANLEKLALVTTKEVVEAVRQVTYR